MRKRHFYPGGGMGELPEPLYRERQPRNMFDPSAGMALDWTNPYRTTNFFFNVGTSTQSILVENPLRCYLVIQNLSTVASVFFSFETGAVVDKSPAILPEGSWEFIGGQAGGSFVPKQGIDVIASAAATPIVVIEGTLEPYNLQNRL